MSDNALLIGKHIAWLRRQDARPTTIKHRTNSLMRLAAGLPVPLIEVTADQLGDWQQQLRDRGLAVASVHAYTSHARRFYSWVMDCGLREDDPSRDLKPPKVPLAGARPIPEDTLRVALACATGQLRVWLMLAAFCGLRAGEIARMRHQDVLNDKLDIPDGKGGKARRVPLPAPVRTELLPFLESGAGRMWTTVRGEVTSPDYISWSCNQHLRECGSGPGVTLHKLRHRYATRMYQLSRDPRMIQHLLGHSSLTVTQIYLAVDATNATKYADELAAELNHRPAPPRPSPRGDERPGWGSVA